MSGTQEVNGGLRKIETRLPPDLLAALRALAKANHRSAAAEMRVAVERHLEQAA